MGRSAAFLLSLLLLTGCAAPPAEEKTNAPPRAEDLTVTVGRQLPLPVTEESLEAYYASSDGFYRLVVAVREANGDYLVQSVPLPDGGSGLSAGTVSRFDYVYTKSGCCYALLEGAYTMEDALHIGQGSVTLADFRSSFQGGPLYVHAGLDRTLADRDTGEPAALRSLFCAAEVADAPLEIPLEDGALLTLEGGGPGALEDVYPGADSLELLFDTSAHGDFPAVEVSYAPSTGELTILCRDTALRWSGSVGENRFMHALRAEQRNGDTAVVCDLGLPRKDGPYIASAYTNAIQAETRFLPATDFSLGVLRITFRPFMG